MHGHLAGGGRLALACGIYSGPCPAPPAISGQRPTASSLLGRTPESLGLGSSLKILVGASWVPHWPTAFTSLVTILTGLESGSPHRKKFEAGFLWAEGSEHIPQKLGWSAGLGEKRFWNCEKHWQ